MVLETDFAVCTMRELAQLRIGQGEVDLLFERIRDGHPAARVLREHSELDVDVVRAWASPSAGILPRKLGANPNR